uniref:Ig-like domain-containing protein n=1 Tax=Cyprinodon variegatus TaxID=28743 RepID=A0A3Q2D889_CYPVA
MLFLFYTLLLMLNFGFCTEDFKFKVKTVTAGQNVTLTCPRQTATLYQETLYWIRLVSGNWPEFLGATFNFEFDEVSKIPYIETKQDQGEFLLHINEAQQNDTGLYYCIKVRQLDFIFMNGTFLKIKGDKSDVTAVLQKPPSGPVYPELPEALQCSVLSNSERSTCPADNRVYWFKAGSDDSHPNLLYLQGNSLDECEKISEAPSIQKCFYNFSETVDPGTYYCAVAACGQILFGNGEKLEANKVERRNVKTAQEETVYTDVKTFY